MDDFENDDLSRVFERQLMAGFFDQIIARKLGDRSHLEVPDYVVIPKVMAVIWAGASHAEVADEVCTEALILERHKEWAESLALSEFLLRQVEFMREVHELSGRNS